MNHRTNMQFHINIFHQFRSYINSSTQTNKSNSLCVTGRRKIKTKQIRVIVGTIFRVAYYSLTKEKIICMDSSPNPTPWILSRGSFLPTSSTLTLNARSCDLPVCALHVSFRLWRWWHVGQTVMVSLFVLCWLRLRKLHTF